MCGEKSISDEAGHNCCCRRCKKFKTIVIFDAEATGLQDRSRRTRFTELCMIAVLTGELLNRGRSPRVVNKLQLCINPQCVVEPSALFLTGLYNDTLEYMASFREQVPVLRTFLANLPKPLCLIAHNGCNFDFPLLQAELHKAGSYFDNNSDIFCADSLEIFRLMDCLPAAPEKAKAKQLLTCQISNIANDSSVVERVTRFADNLKQKVQNKRLVEKIYCETEPSSKIKKIGNIDRIDESQDNQFSQSSLTDKDLLATSEHLLAYASLQLVQETTPTKQIPHISSSVLGLPLNTKINQISFSSVDRKQASRRLFSDHSADKSALQEVGNDKVHSCSPAVQQEQNNKIGVSLSLESEELRDSKAENPESEYNVLQWPSSHTNTSLQLQLSPAYPDNSNRSIQHTATVYHSGSTSNTSIDITSKQSAVSSWHTGDMTAQTNSNASKKPVYKLADVYRRELRKEPHASHTAEGDCITLLELIINRASRFLQYVEQYADPLSSIKPMW